ncbi:thioredoxin isoform X1 [Microcaecilia unicolor]|uniref:Thioredoxin n=1 Tax=Microcaecilia unicolor TaxID=1415580 RepID=A0A6P7X8F2_9AMPH|nr:thioredoxin-like isoform X1 [Microcaecilia unicolor]
MVKHIQSKVEFDQILKEQGDKLVIVDFTASWCGPCQVIAPYYKELSEKYKDILFLKVDVDDVQDLTESCGIRSMPTFIFYKAGKKVAEIKGAHKSQLKAKIEELKS